MSRMLNLYDAKARLSSLVEEAAAGAEIVIAKAGKPRAKLVASAGPAAAGPGAPRARFGLPRTSTPRSQRRSSKRLAANARDAASRHARHSRRQRDDRRLGRAARRAIAHADIVWASAVSGWEVAIKSAMGRLRLDEPFAVLIGADDFTELPITLAHTARLHELAFHHSDPFDRMLVAQSLAERSTIVSHDRALAPYGAPVLWT